MTATATTARPARNATAVYVFAVCRGLAAPALAGLPGHRDGGALRLLAAGSLAAVAQEVPAREHDEEALRRRLAEPAELEGYARAHHEVVAAVAAATTAVPLPLATLYLSEERARQAVAGNAARFHRVLDRLTGRAEWGLKLYALPREPAAAAGAAPVPEAGAPQDPPASGRAYLERLRGRQRDREARREAAWLAAERVDAAVGELAVAARRLRCHGQEAGGPERQVLNATYLVDAGRARELAALVARLRRDPALAAHVRLELTGPWAPYSFADEGEAADGEG
ncbi:GvpL/GvpF family gas vesicle protein [Streptomyces hoynatensis]|uniref:Gas vesicle protein n=1 Tax=Streptomyces hoynatensis TaxID=1141874 RepID=A0A3A9YY51_9ACTN|nr:GvpL/GvpF family gas vesicle protein [Streptomyces hoynatensis]RKN40913.1 gas vesicle protein [Streptomyces hoynatensis]